MRLACTALLIVSLLSPNPAAADEHLVSPQQVQSAVAEAGARRQSDIATLDRTLSTPAAEKAAARVGVDLGQVRRQLPALSDAEAHDLAARAAALDTDPAAGILGTLTDLVVLVLLVLLVIFVARKV
jgi:hypothetical protein